MSAVTVITAVAVFTLTSPASAHVTANANGATQGGYTKVTFRVPNEKDTANTTALEINLPTDTPIASVSLKPMPGWRVTTQKTKLATPVTSGDGELAEATSKVVWMADAANAIKPGQFQEFEVSLGPLPKTEQVVFKALQTYSDGKVVRWIDVPQAGAEEPAHPAPILKLAAATGDTNGAAASSTPPAAAAATPPEQERDNDGTNWLGLIGVALGAAGLIAGLLAYRRATAPAR